VREAQQGFSLGSCFASLAWIFKKSMLIKGLAALPRNHWKFRQNFAFLLDSQAKFS
jgi:hypothetical protein